MMKSSFKLKIKRNHKNLKGQDLFLNLLMQFFSLIIVSQIVLMQIKVVFLDLRAILHSMTLAQYFKVRIDSFNFYYRE
jgi:hypothetical protein